MYKTISTHSPSIFRNINIIQTAVLLDTTALIGKLLIIKILKLAPFRGNNLIRLSHDLHLPKVTWITAGKIKSLLGEKIFSHLLPTTSVPPHPHPKLLFGIN
jgi:hypothetical protein